VPWFQKAPLASRVEAEALRAYLLAIIG
jgi:hypothetical protein